MQVTIEAAETQLEKLIYAAQSGEEVIISDGDMPVAKIVALQEPKKRPFKFGILEGQLGEIPDFLEAMSEDELAL
jgi:antitoxin (DNA-binding transcriptional repressor) of toxin-antitoxin stability system